MEFSRVCVCVCFAVVSCLFVGETAEGSGIHPPERVSTGRYIESSFSSHPRLRFGRSASTLTPAPSHAEPVYVELVLVADRSLFLHHGGDLSRVLACCRSLADRIAHLYQPLNVHIVLVDVVVWSERDEIPISQDIDRALRDFASYAERLKQRIPHDNAQLLTKTHFPGKVGLGYIDSVCRRAYSAGVVSASDDVVAAGGAVAHELGHNLGMRDEPSSSPCAQACPAWGCIMSTGRGEVWSECSRRVLNKYFENGRDHCLGNRPRKQFQTPQPDVDDSTDTSVRTTKQERAVTRAPPPPSQDVVVKVRLLVDSITRRGVQERGRDVQEYCRRLVAAVNTQYRSIRVTVQLAEAVPLSADEQIRIVDDESVDNTLANLGKYALEKASSSHHVVILLTHHKYTKAGQHQVRAVTGKARTRGVCSRGFNVALVSTEQPDRLVQLTLAHELGHLLGMRHDGYAGADRAPACPEPSPLHIMAEVLGDDTRDTLSACSVNTFNRFLQTSQAACLRNDHRSEDSPQSDQPMQSSSSYFPPTHRLPRPVTLRVHLVVAESTRIARGGEQYCRRLMHSVHRLYLQLGINMELSGVSYLNAAEEHTIVYREDIQTTLNSFTSFAAKLRERTPKEYHITILLADTSYPQMVNGRCTDKRIMGRANSDEVCRKDGAVGIVSTAQENEARVAVTLAHELGHLVGINDDNTLSNTPGCPELSSIYVMSGTVTNNDSPNFSQCSINMWQQFYWSDDASCLRNQPFTKSESHHTQSNVIQSANDQRTSQVYTYDSGVPIRSNFSPSQNIYEQARSNGAPVINQYEMLSTLTKLARSKGTLKVLLVVADSTFYRRSSAIHTHLNNLIRMADSYYSRRGMRVRQAGILRLSGDREKRFGSSSKEIFSHFNEYISQKKRERQIPQFDVALLISDVILHRSGKTAAGYTDSNTGGKCAHALGVVDGTRRDVVLNMFTLRLIQEALRSMCS